MKVFWSIIIILIVLGSIFFFYQKAESPVVEDTHADLIKVFSPRAEAVISSPLEVTGEARGTWYFEASFPVYLYDANGQELAVTPAQAQGEWMTTEFVPFRATMEFETNAKEGFLVFQKDNPSDLRELDDEFRIPVRFK